MDARRVQRVSEALREELAQIIEYEMSDPRLAAVTVTEVHVTADLRVARVRVLCGDSDLEAALRALERARHYVRRELAGRLRLWRIPELHFEADSSMGAEGRVEELLERVKKSREELQKSPENTP
jgi:ribosome-binding factor A